MTTPDDARGALDDFLCFGVYSTGLAFNRLYKPLLDRYGITYPQYLVMVALARRDDQTVGELGGQLFLESNTLTPLIKRLETAGLVDRRRDSADERVVRVRLTSQGRGVTQEASACVPEEILRASGLSVEEAMALNKALVALRGHLQGAA
ncbi:MarR family transcriptional regulator [Sphingobium sp. AP49]|uniref:MarR family winged helix-turn-helix transcriptional regulator n=1 Tax=Sphingobium sp. AP49 TaxID=1144307 RepID=UPI00026ED1B2|nr:MarR family transcriptional regulator [Sphingobium sp. AP49]WHO40582.1 MarR family transcriptional regulator [Sphingobium sp. AP49]